MASGTATLHRRCQRNSSGNKGRGSVVAARGNISPPPINPPSGGQGRGKVDGNDWAFGFNAAALIELSPRTRIGLTYVSKVEPKFSGDLKMKTRGPDFDTSSDVDLTLPQVVRIGAYNEINDQWAVLGTLGWEDWSNFAKLLVSVEGGSQSIPTHWKGTYHFSGGAHYRPTAAWQLLE